MWHTGLETLLASPRRILLLMGIGSMTLLGVGYILQYAFGLIPCALCILQRGFFLAVGVTALIGAWQKRGLKLYASVMFVLSLLGGLVALRNVYIQWVPQGLGAKCLPLFASFMDAVTALFQATGDCSKRDWTLLGLSIPEWSLIAFVALLLVSGVLLIKKDPVTAHA